MPPATELNQYLPTGVITLLLLFCSFLVITFIYLFNRVHAMSKENVRSLLAQQEQLFALLTTGPTVIRDGSAPLSETVVGSRFRGRSDKDEYEIERQREAINNGKII